MSRSASGGASSPTWAIPGTRPRAPSAAGPSTWYVSHFFYTGSTRKKMECKPTPPSLQLAVLDGMSCFPLLDKRGMVCRCRSAGLSLATRTCRRGSPTTGRWPPTQNLKRITGAGRRGTSTGPRTRRPPASENGEQRLSSGHLIRSWTELGRAMAEKVRFYVLEGTPCDPLVPIPCMLYVTISMLRRYGALNEIFSPSESFI